MQDLMGEVPEFDGQEMECGRVVNVQNLIDEENSQ